MRRLLSAALCAVVLVMLAPSCGPGDDESQPALVSQPLGPGNADELVLAEAEAEGSAKVLIELTDASAEKAVLAAAGAELDEVRRFDNLPAIAGRLSRAGLEALASDARVRAIHHDYPVHAELAQAVPLVGAQTVHGMGFTGQGVRVAVLDTGIDSDHPDLADDLVAQHCFTQNGCPPSMTSESTSAEDDNGHGTEVAGIITSGGVVSAPGYAPDAGIVAIKVLRADGTGFDSDWLAGLDWLLTNLPTLQVRAVNMSLGTDTLFTGACDGSFALAASLIGQLKSAGVSVFVASGNSASGTAMSSPACIANAIGVGATYDANVGNVNWSVCTDTTTVANKVVCITNSNAGLDLMAPGALIGTSALGGGSTVVGGTSMAAPAAAGVAALLLECDGSLTPSDVEAALEASPTLVTDAKNGLSFPRIDALDVINNSCQCLGAADGSPCSDNNACTQTDTCQAGVCVGGNPKVCNPSDQCHIAGVCNTGTGACSNPQKPNGDACNDNNACTQTDTCQSGSCSGQNPKICTASDQCHVAGTCDTGTGACSNPQKPNGDPCSDGDACTVTDTCQGGGCQSGSPVVCSPLDQCHAAGVCNSGTGSCSQPQKPNGDPCNDSDLCTQTDTCQSGSCSGDDPVICTALDQCHVVGSCSPGTGTCSNPSKPNGDPCSDDDACTVTDTCQGGGCQSGSPVVCSPLDQCHVAGVCNTADGLCSNPNKADGETCSDADACTQTDTCQAGACIGDNQVVCSALDECHDAGTCDALGGSCDDPPKPDGTPCSLGSCEDGSCMSEGGGGAGGQGAEGGAGGGGSPNGGQGGDAGVDAGAAGSGAFFHDPVTVQGACSCRAAGAPSPSAAWLWLVALVSARRLRRGRGDNRTRR